MGAVIVTLKRYRFRERVCPLFRARIVLWPGPLSVDTTKVPRANCLAAIAKRGMPQRAFVDVRFFSRAEALRRRRFTGSSIVPRHFALPQRQANCVSSFLDRRSAGMIL